MDWREVLERAHVECVPRGPHHVLVTLPSGAEAELRLVRSSRTLRPSWVLDHRAEWSNHRVLVLAPDASSQALAQVRAAGQSVVTDSGRVLLQVANELLDRSPAAAAPAKAREVRSPGGNWRWSDACWRGRPCPSTSWRWSPGCANRWCRRR